MQATTTQPSRTSIAPRDAAQVALKITVAVAIAAGLMAFAYNVLPTLLATGPEAGLAAYALGFVVNAITSASIIVPVPGMGALVLMSSELNPWVLAGVAGVGGALGEMFGYWLGTQGRGPLTGSRLFGKIQARMQRYGAGVIFLFAAVPVLPIDAAAMVAGATRYPVARFLVSMAAGKALLLATAFALARLVLS
jgi:membrane protein YqaA with SNARE-associated domain